MESKPPSRLPIVQKYERYVEVSTWIVIILIIFGVRFLPQNLIDTGQAYYLIGGIAAFALLYYLVVYKYFSRSKRLYLKDIADIVLIGVLIHLMKDYGQYFFALYFLPIAAAALELEFMSALLIATIASVFVIFEIFLGSQDLLPQTSQLYQGAWQIGLILLITIFCRFLAMQLRQERALKEESLARQKALEEESVKEKEFISLTSHQLYTPLSIIRGFSSMLTDENLGKLSPKQKNASQEIYANTKRMVALVAELLSISRIQTGTLKLNLKEIKIDDLIENIIAEFKQAFPVNDARVAFVKKSESKPIKIDEDKIRSVLYNLITNALKYCEKGEVKITFQQTEASTTVEVQDQGVGIKDEDKDKLFQPFFRGKNILELDNQGTGLGLYISRLIVEKHQGKIWAKNNPAGGATFGFELPNDKIDIKEQK